LCGAENWTLAVPQKKRIEAAEIKLLRPLAGYTLRDHNIMTTYAPNSEYKVSWKY
jgi:hypothetical protein